MDLASIDALVRLAQSGPNGQWPIPAEERLQRELNTWVALREGDRDTLKRVADWPARRAYRVDPLPERIADAWAHYLVGEDPRIVSAQDADAGLWETLLERDFPSELERGVNIAVSEGETWSRVYVDERVSTRPLLEWVSRRGVLPLWIGGRLMAAGLVTELRLPDGATKQTVYRHMEAHAAGGVVNVLFRGRNDRIGDLIPLDNHPDTAELLPSWDHGLPGMLVDRIPNRLRGDKRIGISDYSGILDYLLDLNEAASIGAHNARLTARKRAVIPASAIDQPDPLGVTGDVPNQARDEVPRPRFDAGEEVFVEDPLDSELGRSTNPMRVLEYSFDAAALIAWKRDLVESAVTRAGLAVQYVGVGAGAEGYAISGTALRLRLIPTDATGKGKARYLNDGLPRILSTMAQVDALPRNGGGFGRPWSAPLEQPVVERRPGLPVDEPEEATRLQTLVNAGLMSKRTAIKTLHPEWDDDEVSAELDEVGANAPPPSMPPFLA
jgi:hypothetical protein